MAQELWNLVIMATNPKTGDETHFSVDTFTTHENASGLFQSWLEQDRADANHTVDETNVHLGEYSYTDTFKGEKVRIKLVKSYLY